MTREQWLDSLKVGDIVSVYIGREHKGDFPIESAPKTFVTVGKYGHAKSFRRSDGLITGNKPLRHLFRIEPPKC